MYALWRLQVTQLLATQRYAGLLLALLAIPAVTVPTGGDLRGDYGIAVALVPFVTAPLAMITATVGSDDVRAIVTVNAGGRAIVLTAEALLGGILAISASAWLVLAPPLLTHQWPSLSLAITGWLCIAAAALAGTAIGLLMSAHVLHTLGLRVFGCIAALTATELAGWVSPVTRGAQLMAARRPPAPMPALLTAVIGATWLVIALALTVGIAHRRRLL